PKTLDPLVPPVDSFTDSYYTQDIDPSIATGQGATGVTIAPGTQTGSLVITFNVSTLENQSARLLFRLIGGSSTTDINSSVAVSNVQVVGSTPLAIFSNNGPVNEGSPVTVGFSSQVGSLAAGSNPTFTYSYDFNNNGNFTDTGDL